jgi:FAD/FMN-containing dehydrogenase
MIPPVISQVATGRERSVSVNDVHSRLNASQARQLVLVCSADAVADSLSRARRRGWQVTAAGGCHAMGGQQFCEGGMVLDTRGMKRVLGLDRDRGLVHVEAGITWPDLIRGYMKLQHGGSTQWGLRQKQTGADRLTVGGALAANIHGRGLCLPPFISDVESFDLVDASGTLHHCSRTENAELFRLVIGGYGLFGVVVAATLRLEHREKLRRVVRLIDIEELPEAFEQRIRDGYAYGDFQFCTAPDDEAFMRHGVFSCYHPVDIRTPIPDDQIRLSARAWERLLVLAHRDKRAAFREFADFYLASTNQIYWSDTHQLNLYLEDYHEALDEHLGVSIPCSEMITELYVPRDRLVAFMADVRRDFLEHDVDLIYGTIRLIERDTESFMPWAREPWACVIFNLHVEHSPAGIAPARAAFIRLIDHAIRHGGSYYLTYHRYARRDQLLACYPEFPQLLQRKLALDPQELFSSDWYRHCKSLVAESSQMGGT